jgi:hypothetical protein
VLASEKWQKRMDTETTLELAGRVHSALELEGVRCIVIGAVALAAHGYVRSTEDVDLAIAVDPRALPELADTLRTALGDAQVELSLSDGNDPLGGVIDIEWPNKQGGPVQIVNFDNSPAGGFPALIHHATTSPFTFSAGSEGLLMSLEYLILSKLYAGGPKSRADVAELLARRKVDLARLQDLAQEYGLSEELRRVLQLQE